MLITGADDGVAEGTTEQQNEVINNTNILLNRLYKETSNMFGKKKKKD